MVLSTAVALATLRSTVGSPLIEVHVSGGTAGLTIEGKSSELIAWESDGTMVLKARLDCVTENRGHASCIKMGDWLRERHLWKLLESSKFHDATLSVPLSQLRMPGEHETFEGDASGSFELHGVVKLLRFHYSARRADGDIHVSGQLTLNLQDFNIKRPTYGDIQTGMLVEVKVQFTLSDG